MPGLLDSVMHRKSDEMSHPAGHRLQLRSQTDAGLKQKGEQLGMHGWMMDQGSAEPNRQSGKRASSHVRQLLSDSLKSESTL